MIETFAQKKLKNNEFKLKNETYSLFKYQMIVFNEIKYKIIQNILEILNQNHSLKKIRIHKIKIIGEKINL